MSVQSRRRNFSECIVSYRRKNMEEGGEVCWWSLSDNGYVPSFALEKLILLLISGVGHALWWSGVCLSSLLAFLLGPTRKMPLTASAMDFFQLFVPDNVLKNMVVQTNMYAKKYQERFGSDDAWIDVTLTEMKAFLGYMISTSIHHCESVLSIWSSGFYSNKSIALIMTQSRFEKILKYFHIVAFRSSQTTHSLYKIQPFLDSLQNGFDSAFRPSQAQVRINLSAGNVWPVHCDCLTVTGSAQHSCLGKELGLHSVKLCCGASMKQERKQHCPVRVLIGVCQCRSQACFSGNGALQAGAVCFNGLNMPGDFSVRLAPVGFAILRMGGCRFCKGRKGRAGAAGLEGRPVAAPTAGWVGWRSWVCWVTVPDLSNRCLLYGPVTQLVPHNRGTSENLLIFIILYLNFVRCKLSAFEAVAIGRVQNSGKKKG